MINTYIQYIDYISLRCISFELTQDFFYSTLRDNLFISRVYKNSFLKGLKKDQKSIVRIKKGFYICTRLAFEKLREDKKSSLTY